MVCAEESGRAVANSRVEIVPDCGHIPQLEQTETTLKLVNDFLLE